MFCRDVFFSSLCFFTFKVTGICRGSEDISSLLCCDEVAKQKSFFHLDCFMGKKCKTPDSSPCSCWAVVLFSRTMFRRIKVLVLLFAVEKSVPSPACGWAFIGKVTLMSMQALFYQLTSLHQIVLSNLM